MLHASYFDTQNVEVLYHDDVNHMFIRSVVFEQKRFKVLRLKMGHTVVSLVVNFANDGLYECI